MKSKTLCSLAVLLIILVTTVVGGFSSRSESYTSSNDLSKASDRRKLYSSTVYKAERLKRCLAGLPFMPRPPKHSGVRVTLSDGSQWVIHQGNIHGFKSQTIAGNDRHMSKKWKIKETKDFHGSKTVSEFANAGGRDYRQIFDNWHARSQ